MSTETVADDLLSELLKQVLYSDLSDYMANHEAMQCADIHSMEMLTDERKRILIRIRTNVRFW